MKKKLLTTMLAAMMTVSTFAAAVPVHAESTGRQDMYRLFNPYNGEHFYTASVAERDHLDAIGWNYEGVGWTAPTHSNTPVYRLFNKYVGDHHYTANKAERDYLISIGWNDEGIGWYSDDAKTVPLYRQYNPNAKSGAHNYTVSKYENDYLDSIGWNAEGIGWYGLGAASSNSSSGQQSSSSSGTTTTTTPATNGSSSSGQHTHNWVTETKTVVDKEAWDEVVPDGEKWYAVFPDGYITYDYDDAWNHCEESGYGYHDYTEIVRRTIHHDAITHQETVTRCSICGATK